MPLTDEVVKTPLIDSVLSKVEFMSLSFFPTDDEKEATGYLSTMIDDRRYEPGLALYLYNHSLAAPANKDAMDHHFETLEAISVIPTTTASLDVSKTSGTKYAYELDGKLVVKNAGTYVFALNTNAPADIYIDNMLVASIYGASVAKNTNLLEPSQNCNSVEKKLIAGFYNIRIRYFAQSHVIYLKSLFRNKDATKFTEVACGSFMYDPAVLLAGEADDDTSWSADNLIQNLSDYEEFIKYFSSTHREDATLKTSIKTTALSNLYVSNDKAPFVALSGLAELELPVENDSTLFSDADINFSGLMASISVISNGNHVRKLLDELNRARVSYNFLDPVNLEKFNNKQDIILPIYTLHQDTLTHDTVEITGGNLTSEYSYLKAYLAFNAVQQFIVRRNSLLVDLLIHIYTSFFIYELIYSPAGSVDQQQILSITKFLLNKLVFLNNEFDSMYQSGNANKIIQDLYGKIQLYKTNAGEINDLNDTIKDSKSTMMEESERLVLEEQQHTTTKSASIISMVFAALFIVFFIGIALLPMDQSQKRMYAIIGLAIALIFCMILFFVREKKIERFVGEDGTAAPNSVNGLEDDEGIEGFETVNPDELQTYLAAKSAMEFEKYLMEMSTLDHFTRYLQNTINLALILQTSQTYNNINYSTSKELQYFINTQTQVDNASASLKSRHRLHDLQSKKHRAGIMLSIAMVFIVSLMVTLYIVADGNVKARQVIVGAGILCIILSVLMYFLEVQSRVRTNADKYYWGQPSQDMIHQL